MLVLFSCSTQRKLNVLDNLKVAAPGYFFRIQKIQVSLSTHAIVAACSIPRLMLACLCPTRTQKPLQAGSSHESLCCNFICLLMVLPGEDSEYLPWWLNCIHWKWNEELSQSFISDNSAQKYFPKHKDVGGLNYYYRRVLEYLYTVSISWPCSWNMLHLTEFSN